MKNALATGDLSTAQAQALALLELATNTVLEDPKGPETTEEALSRLLDELFDLTGLEAPGVDPEQLASGEAVVVVVRPDSETTVVVGTGEAGVFFPEGSVEETVLVVVERIELGEGADCLPTIREQREGCYRFRTIPEQAEDFTLPVKVGICVDVTGLSDNQIEHFHLYGFDEGDLNVRELENTSVDFLNCGEPVALGDQGLLTRFAYALSRGLGRLLGPQELLAADLGLGGLTRSFTRIGWAGATALIYGPSLTPALAFRPGTNEQTIAESLGIAATVVDGTTWSSMSATGFGGFADYDAIVFGDGGLVFAGFDEGGNRIPHADFIPAETNTSWGSIATGPVLVSGIHAATHICEVGCPPAPFSAGQFPPSARTFVETGLAYAVSGTETGVFAALGARYAWAQPAVPVEWLSGLDAFTALNSGPKVFGTLTDDTKFIVPTHPVLSGFTEAELSGWFATIHNFLVAVPPGFTAIATGNFWNRPGPPGHPLNDPNSSDQMSELPAVIVRGSVAASAAQRWSRFSPSIQPRADSRAGPSSQASRLRDAPAPIIHE